MQELSYRQKKRPYGTHTTDLFSIRSGILVSYPTSENVIILLPNAQSQSMYWLFITSQIKNGRLVRFSVPTTVECLEIKTHPFTKCLTIHMNTFTVMRCFSKLDIKFYLGFWRNMYNLILIQFSYLADKNYFNSCRKLTI